MTNELEPVEPDNGAHKLRDQMLKSVDNATCHVIEQLNDLQNDIEALKQHLIEHATDAKRVLHDHFNLGAEALAFGQRVRRRLGEVANGYAQTQDQSDDHQA